MIEITQIVVSEEVDKCADCPIWKVHPNPSKVDGWCPALKREVFPFARPPSDCPLEVDEECHACKGSCSQQLFMDGALIDVPCSICDGRGTLRIPNIKKGG